MFRLLVPHRCTTFILLATFEFGLQSIQPFYRIDGRSIIYRKILFLQFVQHVVIAVLSVVVVTGVVTVGVVSDVAVFSVLLLVMLQFLALLLLVLLVQKLSDYIVTVWDCKFSNYGALYSPVFLFRHTVCAFVVTLIY